MRVRLDDIRDGGLVCDFVAAAADFTGLAELIAAGDAVFEAPIAVRLRLSRVDELVEVDGQLQSSVRLACGRCLRDFSSPLAAIFSLTYARTLPKVEDEEGGELELSADDLGMTLLEGDEIDFSEAVQEQVLLALPFRPLCSDGCRGLCPHCGADLNSTSCNCRDDGFGNKFAALKNFKIDER